MYGSIIIILIEFTVVSDVILDCLVDTGLEADWLHLQIGYGSVGTFLDYLFEFTCFNQ